jgi:hypothetical protein
MESSNGHCNPAFDTSVDFFSMPRQILQLSSPISILAVHFDSDLEMGQISGSVNF